MRGILVFAVITSVIVITGVSFIVSLAVSTTLDSLASMIRNATMLGSGR